MFDQEVTYLVLVGAVLFLFGVAVKVERDLAKRRKH